MNKIKKFFVSFGIFITGLISKVSAVSLHEQTKYGVFDPEIVEAKYGIFDPRMVEDKYGVFEPTMGEKISSIGKIALPIVLFAIGLFVVLSKKFTKKVKAIVVSILVILAILGYVLMNYFSKNF